MNNEETKVIVANSVENEFAYESCIYNQTTIKPDFIGTLLLLLPGSKLICYTTINLGVTDKDITATKTKSTTAIILNPFLNKIACFFRKKDKTSLTSNP